MMRLVVRLQDQGLNIDVGVRLTTSPDTRFVFGSGCTVMPGSLLVLDDGELTLRDDVLIGEYANLRAWKSTIRIGSGVQIAQFVSLIAANHQVVDGIPQRGSIDLRPGWHGITIGDDCWHGTQATVLPGVTLGDRSIVAAGAVVVERELSGGIGAARSACQGAASAMYEVRDRALCREQGANAGPELN